GCQQHPTQCSTHHLTQPSPWAHRPTTRPWLVSAPPASLQPGLHGCPEGGPLSIPWPLWLPLGYVVCVCEWCAGAVPYAPCTVPYAPCVLCVSCLYTWLPLMLTRWGTILARVGWDQTLFSSSPEIMLPKISSQTQRMGWWGAPCEVGTSGVLLQLTLG
uniref:Shisa family member 5 n=1 Tax=Gorilla gorilla gorilla TaxID=9595 RepID=A0A2I2YUZ8_GORGO